MPQCCHRGVFLLCSLLVVFCCSKKEQEAASNHGSASRKPTENTFLDVHRILGSTPDALIQRFGEPKPYIREREGVFGNITWKDLYGVRVFTVIIDGKCAYVHYTFNELEPFDEQEAFQIVGIVRPKHEPQLIPHSEAKRWKPFEQYERLTVNPKRKSVAVRAYPFEW